MAHAELDDDPTIQDSCELLRRIPIKPRVNIIWDGNQDRWRPSSASFNDHPNGTLMSIVLRDELEKAGRDPAEVLIGHDGFALAAITAGFVREQQQRVTREPLPEEPAHGIVIGEKKKSSKKMAKAAQWVIPPDLAPPE
jgi:hypothetical protein